MTPRILKSISDKLSKFNINNKMSLAIAASGGMDSMFLLFSLLKLGFKPIIIHFNYQLRSEDSERDEILVKRIALSNDLPCHIEKVNISSKTGVQEVARQIRYSYFHELIDSGHVHAIFTAHHGNDQIETMLFRLSRTTGIQGLTGIPESRSRIFRPLLDFVKEDIAKCCDMYCIPFRSDISNRSSKYSRNRIRNQIIPELKLIFPSVEKRWLLSREILKMETELLDFLIDSRKKEYILNTQLFNYLSLQWLPKPSHKKAFLIRYGSSLGINTHNVKELVACLAEDNKSFVIGNQRWTSYQSGFIQLIAPPSQWSKSLPTTTLEINHPIVSNGIEILLAPHTEGQPPNICQNNPSFSFDNSIIIRCNKECPIHIRSFYDLSMQQDPINTNLKATILKIMKDAKVPHVLRPFIPVVTDHSEQVLAVGGFYRSNMNKNKRSNDLIENFKLRVRWLPSDKN